MNAKAFEIRDKATFIPALAVRMVPAPQATPGDNPSTIAEKAEAERYLLGRAGYGPDNLANPLVMLVRMDADGGALQASYDAYGWGGDRTMTVAQEYIMAHWDELESGAVICVEHILGERETPKVSEREDHL